MSERGFARVLEAIKGVGKLAQFLAERPAPAMTGRLSPEPRTSTEPASSAKACARVQTDGWRCVVQGPHRACIIERITP